MAVAPIIDVWRHRNFAIYMGGMTPNLVTIWMMRVGVGWLAWELTKSPTWLGLIAAADLVPMLLLGLFAGAITDRMDPLKQARQMQWVQLAHAVALSIFMVAGWLSIQVLFVLQLLLGLSHPFASTARHAIVPAVVPRESYATAVATDSALFNGSRFLGPMLAALLMPLTGVVGAFVVHAAGCGIFLVALYVMAQLPPRSYSHKSKGGLITDMGDTLRFVFHHRGIWPLFLLLTAVSVCLRPVQDMLPGFAGDVFQAGPVGLAWLISGMGVGAMVSAIWVASYGRVTGLTTLVIVACLVNVITTFGFVWTNWLWLGVLFSTLWGFTFNIMSTSAQALVQTTIEDNQRGRVMGLFTVIYRGTPAFGALGTGIVAEIFGLQATFAVAALLCLAAWFYVAPQREAMVRELEEV